MASTSAEFGVVNVIGPHESGVVVLSPPPGFTMVPVVAMGHSPSPPLSVTVSSANLSNVCFGPGPMSMIPAATLSGAHPVACGASSAVPLQMAYSFQPPMDVLSTTPPLPRFEVDPIIAPTAFVPVAAGSGLMLPPPTTAMMAPSAFQMRRGDGEGSSELPPLPVSRHLTETAVGIEDLVTAQDNAICALVSSQPNPSNSFNARMLVALRQYGKNFPATLPGETSAKHSDTDSVTECSNLSIKSRSVESRLVTAPLCATLPPIKAQKSGSAKLELLEPRCPPPMPKAPTGIVFVATHVDIIPPMSLASATSSSSVSSVRSSDGKSLRGQRKHSVELMQKADDDKIKSRVDTAMHGSAKEPSPRNEVPFIVSGTPETAVSNACVKNQKQVEKAIGAQKIDEVKDSVKSEMETEISTAMAASMPIRVKLLAKESSATSKPMDVDMVAAAPKAEDVFQPVAVSSMNDAPKRDFSLPRLKQTMSTETEPSKSTMAESSESKEQTLERLLEELKNVPLCLCEKLEGEHFHGCVQKQVMAAILTQMSTCLPHDGDSKQSDDWYGSGRFWVDGMAVGSDDVHKEFVEGCRKSDGGNDEEIGRAVDCRKRRRGANATQSALDFGDAFHRRVQRERGDQSSQFQRLLNGHCPEHVRDAMGGPLYGHRDFVDAGFFEDAECVERYLRGYIRLTKVPVRLRRHLKLSITRIEDRTHYTPLGELGAKILRVGREETRESERLLRMAEEASESCTPPTLGSLPPLPKFEFGLATDSKKRGKSQMAESDSGDESAFVPGKRRRKRRRKHKSKDRKSVSK